ncbi:MAG: class I SAM-dependent DNA methyltransferase [Verrucomicrobia bacterium]|nr:class I SAM-dependent DNA methyltransferase [Verrucomicrobiota bacterium]
MSNLTAAQFKKKWSRYTGKESSAYQEHFNDLCRLIGHPTPVEADPSGHDFFCFQKGVLKDPGLLNLGGPARRRKKGWADVWKKDCFGWEYKGKHKNLEQAYDQLKLYREALLNPPLLVVCDFDRFVIRTNFNGTAPDTLEFTNDEIEHPETLRLLIRVFTDPGYLKPQRTTQEVTAALAAQIAEVARSLQGRECVELSDAETREQVQVAQKRNLRIARFLNRMIFCFFAEDTGLLPKKIFSDICRAGLDDPKHFAVALGQLFRVMAKGGAFGHIKIRHFNGHLFEDATVFELTEEEISKLAEAAEKDWQCIEPSILGTLFERAIDERQRAQLGAHYTSREDIVTIVEPVLMAPLRREWSELKAELGRANVHDGQERKIGAHHEPQSPDLKAVRKRLEAFQKKLATFTVLDPACGSGNFLYVALQLLLDLEKEVITFAIDLGLDLQPQVNVQQLKAIEINPYAFELAQVSVQIGYLLWLRDNGFPLDRSPVLQVLDGFENKDALLNQTFRKKPKSLTEAQAGEHAEDEAIKVYTERAWPECDVIVSNPPFLGGKLLRRELGDHYVEALFGNFKSRVRPEADLCCYWFEKTREQIEQGKCRRAGLLGTQGIRGGANRATLSRIKETGDIFFAVSDQEWTLDGATVHVSMVGFDCGNEPEKLLDGQRVAEIGPSLSSGSHLAAALELAANLDVSFMGITPGGPFDLPFERVSDWLASPNPTGRPNSDVLRPYFNGQDINRRQRGVWTIDFGVDCNLETAAGYELPLAYLRESVMPIRAKNRREAYARKWWSYAEPRPAMRQAFEGKPRFLATCMVAKHRIFVWLDSVCLPANVVIVFGRSDDYFFGVLHSRLHLVWATAQSTQLRERESGERYTPTTCFETFPFPFPDGLQIPAITPKAPPSRVPEPDRTYAEMMAAHFYSAKEAPRQYGDSPKTAEEHRTAIATAAKDLNELRERWLNPPEWTSERVLEFPASVNGPWSRYIDPASVDSKTGIGTVRYPRREPSDAECAARLKKRTLTKLYNERPTWLSLAHKKLDEAVAAAYGWPPDLAGEQILERLLTLNLQRAGAERATEEEHVAEKKKGGKLKARVAQRGRSAAEII